MPVSIIIGNYNYARYLPDAVNSALSQDHTETEVVVVDDGSTDDSRQVIAGYGSRIIPVLKQNGGMGSTYNAGLRVCSHDVIIFLDADDVLMPTAARHADCLLSEPDAVKAHWPLWEVGATLQRTGHVLPARTLAEGDLREAMIRDGPDGYLSPPTSGNAWSRRFLEWVLPVPEAEFRQHADTYLYTLAPVYGRIRAASEPQALYRVHGGNDYAAKAMDERNRRNLAIYGRRCFYLSQHLERVGVHVAAGQWQAGTPAHDWMRRLDKALRELERLVPPGDSFVLADEGQWGGQVLTGRRTIPFPERHGRYGGPPADGVAAVSELERLRAAGHRLVAFGWPAFWWLDYYADLAGRLHRDYVRIVSNPELIVFVPRDSPTDVRADCAAADLVRP